MGLRIGGAPALKDSGKKVSPNRAAKIVGVDRKTMLRWCHEALAGRPSWLHKVERNRFNRRILIDAAEVRALKGKRH